MRVDTLLHTWHHSTGRKAGTHVHDPQPPQPARQSILPRLTRISVPPTFPADYQEHESPLIDADQRGRRSRCVRQGVGPAKSRQRISPRSLFPPFPPRSFLPWVGTLATHIKDEQEPTEETEEERPCSGPLPASNQPRHRVPDLTATGGLRPLLPNLLQIGPDQLVTLLRLGRSRLVPALGHSLSSPVAGSTWKPIRRRLAGDAGGSISCRIASNTTLNYASYLRSRALSLRGNSALVPASGADARTSA